MEVDLRGLQLTVDPIQHERDLQTYQPLNYCLFLLLIQKGTYTNTVSTSKPNLRVGKIVAYNCLREKGEIIVFSDTSANNNSADVMEKHLE